MKFPPKLRTDPQKMGARTACKIKVAQSVTVWIIKGWRK